MERSNDYVIRVCEDPSELDPQAWDALLHASPAPSPFMRHAYLHALHQSASAVPATGWTPRFLCAQRNGELVGACALYLKAHSYGEYVFDWAWANAYEQHGLQYYPKLLCAVPFTPVPGARLLARDTATRVTLLQAMRQLAHEAGLSSAHVLFLCDEDRIAAEQAGWMIRRGVQFHWNNRKDLPYRDFSEFLAGLQRDKRKKIQQERRRVQESGVEFSVLEGSAITSHDWDFFYRCYQLTYRAHGSSPYLTREFFEEVGLTLRPHWLMFIARQGDERVAASLVAIDRETRRAYGRYWGCVRDLPFLHFEACYYQPLEWCIRERFDAFEGGAQGEHKMARGLMPVPTASAHWLSHPAFADAVARFLEREGSGIGEYLSELQERSPFKRETMD